MADTKYKKGELLFGKVITTYATPNDSGANSTKQISLELNQDVLIAIINDIEYVCEANKTEFGNVYGGFSPSGPDFSIYPFAYYTFYNSSSESNLLSFYTENPGTYSLHIYAAIEDTDSTPLFPTDFIIDYLMKSPQNSNWNVLSSLLGDGDWSRLKAYVETTPKNMNRQVLKALLGNGSSSSGAVVGTAVVGRDTVG